VLQPRDGLRAGFPTSETSAVGLAQLGAASLALFIAVLIAVGGLLRLIW
jgi:hypothetical protein